MTKWTRIEDGYRSGDVTITDNGRGLGPAQGSGRWAVTVAGKWVANVDTLDEAKVYGEPLDVDLSDFSDDYAAGFVAGAVHAKSIPASEMRSETLGEMIDRHERGPA